MADSVVYINGQKILAKDSGSGNFALASYSYNPSFSVMDSVTRPANNTPYAATPQSINCNLTLTEIAYTLLVVTVKVTGHGLVAGDRFTLAGVNTGATLTNMDGNWVVASKIDADHFTFAVTTQPTGTTPQTGLTITGAVAKCLSVDIAGVAGGSVLISNISATLPGVAMLQPVRLYVYTVQPTVLVDQSTFTILAANDTYRRRSVSLYPVTEGSGSDVTFANDETMRIIKCAAADTRLYFRLASEAAGTPATSGVVTVRMTGLQLLG